jgi:tetratricopeptide (TPR) repeat protein
VQSARGKLDAALEAYQKDLSLAEKLAALDPSNSVWQRDLSVICDRIGDVQRARGNLDAALNAYQDGLDLREKLAAQDPSNTGWQRDLIVSNVKLAEVAEVQDGEASQAKRHYDAALDVALALRDAGRLAPKDAWMVGDLQARLERVSAQATP